jgi:uncharacterized protein (TIGR02001 family)
VQDKIMQYAFPTGAFLALLVAAPAMAEEAATTPEHTFTANVGLFSQYIFRGISQTRDDPALQGGFDYAHFIGLYLGTWASSISWLKEGGDDQYYRRGGSAEIDFHGGYKSTFGDTRVGYDVGLLYYRYPGDHNPESSRMPTLFRPTPVCRGSWFTAKYSYSLLDRTFGSAESQGTWYFDLVAVAPLSDTGATTGVHWGRQDYHGAANGIYSYNDWRVSLAYDVVCPRSWPASRLA